MRPVLPIALIALLVLVAGCGSRRGKPLTTAGYGSVDQGTLLAWAWGGAPGFEGSSPSEVVVLFDVEPGDSGHRLASCDSRESECKKLQDFADTGERARFERDSFLGRFETGDDEEDRLFLVVADRGSRLVTSDIIVANVASRPTRFAGGEIRFNRGTHELAWPRLADGNLFILTLVDRASGRPLSAIATRRKSWTYPELQGIVKYFHDAAAIRELRPGGTYVAVLYAVNRQQWATVVTSAVVRP
jgi:hypothetical protein